ncbi:MAG: HPr family phosphocarrier protein [Lachnospiraceae bacterium]
MIKKSMTIQIPSGLEARPVALLVQVASQHECSIYVEADNKKVNAKSIMGMMTLGLAPGEEVVVTADGVDEEKAIQSIEQYLTTK